MIIGTSHFLNRRAAERYFRPQYHASTTAVVTEMLRRGEINIGRPMEKPGERTFLIDNGTRWAIEDKS